MLNIHNTIIAEISPIIVGIFVFIGFTVLVWTVFIHMYGRLWLQAKLSGVSISLAELVGMTIRKVNAKQIVENLIVAKHGGLDLQRSQLEVHYLVGGNISDVVRAMTILERANLNPGWEILANEDLQGRNVLEDAQLSVQRNHGELYNNDGDFLEESENI